MSFRVTRLSDKRTWVLEEKGIKGGNSWLLVGYYGKLEDLAITLLNRQIEVPEGTLQNQVKDLLAEIKAAEKRIAEELKQAVTQVAV